MNATTKIKKPTVLNKYKDNVPAGAVYRSEI